MSARRPPAYGAVLITEGLAGFGHRIRISAASVARIPQPAEIVPARRMVSERLASMSRATTANLSLFAGPPLRYLLQSNAEVFLESVEKSV